VTVTFRWGTNIRDVRGILDTGADRTQIPEALAQDLRLRPTGDLPVTSANNTKSISRLYVVDVEFDGRSFPTIEVIASQLPIALVGRDILNTLVAEFDGPAREYSLRP
jgi:predicted aspartyl protease